VCCFVVELFGVKPIELGSTCSANLDQIHRWNWEPTSSWSPFGLTSCTRDKRSPNLMSLLGLTTPPQSPTIQNEEVQSPFKTTY